MTDRAGRDRRGPADGRTKGIRAGRIGRQGNRVATLLKICFVPVFPLPGPVFPLPSRRADPLCGPLILVISRWRLPGTRLPPRSIFCYHLLMAAGFRDVDPAELRLPPSRSSGADPYKLQRQIARYGASAVGMPPVWVYEGSDGVLEIINGATRATRIAKLAPGTPIRVEVIGKLRQSRAQNPKVGDRL
jgi:hypothetical protein